MTKLNKRILATAIAAAVMLPSFVSAADLTFASSQQITFARDLIVNNGTTILTPNDLDLRAEAIDAANMGTIAAGSEVRFKVTLTNGATFDSTADVNTLVQNFLIGPELGGAAGGTAVGDNITGNLVGTPFYSASGQELNFTVRAIGIGNDAVAPAFAIKMNSFQITNLKGASDAGQSISAEVTAQNASGQQVLAAREVIADFKVGITSRNLAQDPSYAATRIDVSSCTGTTPTANRTRFSPNGNVADSCAAGAPANTLYGVGGLTLDITKADEVGGVGPAANTYINNFSAVAANPQYNVVNTATWTFTVSAPQVGLKSFTGGDLFLTNSATCAVGPAGTAFGTIADGATSASLTVPAGNALVSNLSSASPSPANIQVCFRADDTSTMVPLTPLSLAWSINYDLPTQRVNPPGDSHDLKPLLLNGTTITFQNVNPGGNTRAQSFIRLTNHNAFECPITLDAKDDAGVYTADSGRVIGYKIPAQGSWTINSEAMEAGGAAGTSGSFGDGAGRWYVRVTAECANVIGSALNRNLDTGVVTNLTSERNNDKNLFGR